MRSICQRQYTGVPCATYYASKAALNQLTRTTALEYASRRIRVNAILPGLMKTPMVEKSAGLAESYAGGDVEEMWRARDRQVPMRFGGDAVGRCIPLFNVLRRRIGSPHLFDGGRDSRLDTDFHDGFPFCGRIE